MSETLDIEPLASPPLSEPWVPLWPLAPARLGELAYAEIIAQVSVTATTEATANAVITAPAVTVDGSTPIIVEFSAQNVVIPNLAYASLTLFLFDGSTSLGQIGGALSPAGTTPGNMAVPVRVARRLTPSVGAHTYSIRAIVSSSNGFVNAGPGGTGQQVPAFIRISLAAPLLSAPPGAAVAVQYGTSLPTNPLDGQEAILVDSLTNPTYQWRFRYNAGSTSAYKWEFVGGVPARSFINASETPSPLSTWVDLATVGPSFVVPRAGDYTAAWSALYTCGAGGAGNTVMGLGRGADASPSQVPALVAAGAHMSVYSERGPEDAKLAAIPAGTELRARYYAQQATSAFSARRLFVTPIRVS